jgi:uncharacterized C2H2 Zn-finger protein
MPKIKVYKGNGALVPVDTAKVSTGYQCPWTNKLFATKKAYVNHLAKVREERIRNMARKNYIIRKLADLHNQPDLESIINWVQLNSDFILNRAKSKYAFGNEQWPAPEEFQILITMLRVKHYPLVSNSHSCPRNGKTNWGGQNKDVPRGYPGWEGRIEFCTSHDIPGFSSDLFRGTGIHLGSGGGMSRNRFGYEVRLYDSDWPGLEKQFVFNTLANKGMEDFYHGTPHYFR